MNVHELRDYLEGELKHRRPALFQEFSAASEVLRRRLDFEDHLAWERDAVSIAQGSFRFVEAAAEYFKASVPLANRLRPAQLTYWSRLGRSLLSVSPALAAAFFRSSPAVLDAVFIDEFELWIAAAHRIRKDSSRLHDLAAQFFDLSPALFRTLSIEGVTALADMVAQLSRQSADIAAECLDQSVPLLPRLDRTDRLPVLKSGVVLAELNAKGARSLLLAAPEVLGRLQPKQRAAFLELVSGAANHSVDRALRLFRQGSQNLSRLDGADSAQLLAWSTELATICPDAGAEFLLAGPELLPKLGLNPLGRWMGLGLAQLRRSQDAGVAFFRLQSRQAHQALAMLSHVCELETIQPVLRLYCQALTGRDLAVSGTPELVAKDLGWKSVRQATSDGSAIYLPPRVELFSSREENFAYYKVLATHQAAHVEFGSFDYVHSRSATVFENLRWERRSHVARETTSDLEAFFDLFPQRTLAKQLFVILEDGRVDAAVIREYAGIRADYNRARRLALSTREAPWDKPARQAIVEVLLLLSLDPAAAPQSPRGLAPLVESVVNVALLLWSGATSLADTAEATIRLYDLIHRIRNLALPMSSLEHLPDAETAEDSLTLLQDIAQIDEVPFAGPADVDYRGAIKPELVEALTKVRREDCEGAPGPPLSPEAIRRLLEKNRDGEIAISDDNLDGAIGQFVDNLLRERGKERRRKRRAPHPGYIDDQEATDTGGKIETDSTYYDEWDFRAADYRTRWCRLRELLVQEGSLDFYRETIRNNGPLVRQVRQQFELLRPELWRKIKPLEDGEDIYLDALVEAWVDRRSGHGPSPKVYWRRNKAQRDVAVAFLLDMSASTEDEIEEAEHNPWHREGGATRGKRIIDVEKESLVLLTQALEAIGDRYGIYGFSGQGRDNCEFYVVKDFDEAFGDLVKRRIDKIAPVRGTRMGVAIRHATVKLEAEEARLRILVLLSDGHPQDHGAHHNPKDTEYNHRDYALHDTRMALLEAKRKNIVPFCLTVDKRGQDYLRTMCADIGYEIVNDVRVLPRRLPALYRTLSR